MSAKWISTVNIRPFPTVPTWSKLRSIRTPDRLPLTAVGVDDLGRIVNEPIAFGQVTGGIAQAIGEVLMEAAYMIRIQQLLTDRL